MIQKQVLFGAAILEAVAAPLLVWFLILKKGWELPARLGWSCLIIGAAALLAGILTRRMIGKVLQNASLENIWVSIITAGILAGGFFTWQFNVLESMRTEAVFARRMKTVAESFPHNRVAFYHRPEDKVIFYMEWNPPVITLKDEGELREFLGSKEPGVIIGQSRYITETVAAMLPVQPSYAESSYRWESAGKKLRAWLVSGNSTQVAEDGREANRAK